MTEAGRGEAVLERSGRSERQRARSAWATSKGREAAPPKTPQGSLERAIASEGCHSERQRALPQRASASVTCCCRFVAS